MIDSLRRSLQNRRSILWRYGVAALATGAAFLFPRLLAPFLGNLSSFTLFILAVLVSAGYGGLGPGLFSASIITAAGTVFTLNTAAAAGMTPDFAPVKLFAVEGVLISVLNEALYRTRERASRGAAELAHSEERFELLVENVVDYAILMLDPEGIVTTWNPGAERIKGYRAEEVIGKPFSMFYPQEDIQADKPARDLETAAREGRLVEEGWRVRNGGARFWASGILTALRDGEGRLRGFSKITRDLTEWRKAEEIVRENQAALEAANARLRRAMMETHHRVKNSLQMVAAMVDLRLVDAGETVPVEELHKINRSVLVLAEVHAMLTGAARKDGLASAVSVREMLEKLLPLMQSGTAVCQIQHSLDELTLDGRLATSLTLVVNELVLNALKHCRSEVRVELRVYDDRAELSVADDGSGFPSSFSASDKGRTGLELVENLVEWDLRGATEYLNGPSGGALVKVTFPVARDVAGEQRDDSVVVEHPTAAL